MNESRTFSGLPGLRWSAFLLVALSLSIGWGIRGNFGHEYGAMLPGALAAIAACLISGRADWRERVAYFGMFGALGWAFGASISYMQVIGFTHSGDAASQYYGFFCLFVIGFLWGGLGGAGTALPAVMERGQLTELIRPMCWVFGAWMVQDLVVFPLFEHWEDAYSATWSRQESPLYWFDADWIQATTAVIAMCLFDLWERSFLNKSRWWDAALAILVGVFIAVTYLLTTLSIFPEFIAAKFVLVCFALAVLAIFCLHPRLFVYVATGAFGGFMVHLILRVTGMAGLLGRFLIQYQGDMEKARESAAAHGISLQEVLTGYVINWPQFVMTIPQHLGWIVGIIAAVGCYFYFHGKFRSGSSLFLYMGLGWLASFILFPTLLGFGGAGFRMTPPRSDDWAGILGVYAASLLWLHRKNLPGVLVASLITAAVGGLGFSGAAFIKLLLVRPGNPEMVTNPAVIEAWQHWQSANWHSFLEQTYGFINGIGIALAMGWLAKKQGEVSNEPRVRPWTEVFAVSFILLLLTALNIYKNVPEWIEKKCVPAVMQMPLLDRVELPAGVWFGIVWGLLSAMGIYLLVRHMRRPIALVPESWLGKGQLFYLVLLWMIVVANFERALPGFSAQRILTEGVIFVNAILVTGMILVWPAAGKRVPERGLYDFEPAFTRSLLGVLAAVLIATLGMTYTVRCVYDGKFTGHAGKGTRFGEDATWRVAPIEKGKKHS